MASVLKVKDANGNTIDIPAIRGKDGKDYVLTEADKAEIAEMVKPNLQMIDAVVGNNALIHTQNAYALAIEADIPFNARVKRIEIPDVVNGTDEYIALEDMVSKDDAYRFSAPYFIMYPKNCVGLYMPFVVANVVFGLMIPNSYFEQADSFYDKTIKIFYEIEE